jgi:hypothetical protein
MSTSAWSTLVNACCANNKWASKRDIKEKRTWLMTCWYIQTVEEQPFTMSWALDMIRQRSGLRVSDP